MIELHIRHVEGGNFTDHVFADMHAKAMLRIEAPLGSFFLREDSDRPVILVINKVDGQRQETEAGDAFTDGQVGRVLDHLRELGLYEPALIVFTAVVGMLLASPGMVPLDVFVFGTLGIGLSSASAAAINHVVDQKIDAIMGRTRGRPLPQGAVNGRDALIFALALGVAAMVILVALVNPLTALLTFFSLIGYAVVYTMYLKRATPQNIVIGGAAGAAPPVLGWAAVTGSVDPGALLLFLIIFAWTPPHFWALAIHREEEYRKVDMPMLPVTHGKDFTRLQILLYTVLLLVVTLLPYGFGMSGGLYLGGAMVLGLGFLYYAVRLYRNDDERMPTPPFPGLENGPRGRPGGRCRPGGVRPPLRHGRGQLADRRRRRRSLGAGRGADVRGAGTHRIYDAEREDLQRHSDRPRVSGDRPAPASCGGTPRSPRTP